MVAESEDFVGGGVVCRCQRRSDTELGWSKFDHYPEIDVFTAYSGMSDITELDGDSNIPD